MPAFSNEKVDGTKLAFGWSPIRFAFGEGFEFVFFCVSRVLFVMKKSFELNASKKLLGVEFGAEFVGIDDKFYKQINGVAMGTKMGPNYANLFVGYVEERIFDQFDGPVAELFGRYIDDCFGATSCGRPELDRFIQFVNTFHPALEFTSSIFNPNICSKIKTLHLQQTSRSDLGI